MANAFVVNASLQATDHAFSLIWKLTRAIKFAGGTYKGSGDGTSKDTTGSPDSDLWNGSGGAVAGQTGAAASITTVDRGIATVTGLTGMVSTHVGHYLTITGAASGGNNGAFLIVEYLSSSSVRIRNSGAVASDANNGSISWTQKNPLQESYPTGLDSVSAWWHCWGVATVKVPVSTNSTGTYLRGEKVTQATSNAEGELLGFMYDSVTPANSFLVILPRIGTFDGSNVITGASSGATITPSASPVVYQAEFVFWKANNTTTGTAYYARASTSDTQLNSLVGSAGCTATVAPGGGGTGNSFPTGSALVARGTGGAATHAAWLYTTTPGAAKYQISVANMIGLANQSPDGNFWVMYGMPGLGATESHGFGYFRCDNGEPGDVDPFVWYYPASGRTQTSSVGTLSTGSWSNSANIYTNTINVFPGWRRRSFPSGDAFQTFEHASLVYLSAGLVIVNTFGTPETVACQTNTVRVAEPLWAITKGVTTKMRKGTLRWWMQTPTGTAYDHWDFNWVQVFTATSSFPGIMLGPWDGSSSPAQTLPMAHVYLLNKIPSSENHAFSQVWWWTRAMKKAGAKYRASGNGTIKDTYATPTNANPANDLWGGGGTVPGQTGSAASITTKTLDDLTVTGLTGMTSSSANRFLTITGASSAANNGTWQIVSYISATSVTIRNPNGVASDANNGSISWTETDPALDTYPTALNSVAAWWVAELNRTIKIPINTPPTGTFLRGEKITQATSNAEGEIVGVAYGDATNSYLVIQPRIGTFTNTNTHTITGAFSGATINPSGSSLTTWIEEIVVAKTTDIFNGWIFCQRIEETAENTSKFSYLAHNAAGCTATVSPANGGTGNAFPTAGTYVVRGAGAGAAVPFYNSITTTTSSMGMGKAQIVAADNIGKTGYSPDPTSWIVQAMPGDSSNTYGGFGHFRCEDTEPGDVDPVIWWVNNANGSTRTSSGSGVIGSWTNFQAGTWSNSGGASTVILGWRRRGYSTNDAWTGALLPSQLQTLTLANGVMILSSDPEKVASYPADNFTRDPIPMICATSFAKVRKGSPKWLSGVPSGSPGDLWNSSTYLQVMAVSTAGPGVLVGPWDGSTNPDYTLSWQIKGQLLFVALPPPFRWFRPLICLTIHNHLFLR